MKTLQAAGAVRAKGEGYIVSPSYLREPDVEERVVNMVDYVHRRLSELVKLGLNPHGALPYFAGPPALLSV